jgi:hypothetical protein
MFFLTTQPENSIYKLIVNSCRKHSEKIFRRKLDIKLIKKKRFSSFSFLLYFFFFIFSGKFFFKKNRLYQNYSGVEIGRFIIAEVLNNDSRSYSSKIFFYFNYLKSFFKAGVLLNTAKDLLNNNNFKSLYVDHCCYLNGILYSFFIGKKIIYTNNHPRSIFYHDTKRIHFKKTYEDRLKIEKKFKIIKKSKILKIRNFINKLVNYPETIPWMSRTKFKKYINIPNIKDYDYVIYTHSFTDGQLLYGNDDFESTFDWLDFTLNHLLKNNKKVLIKCHPNFFNKDFGYRAIWDRQVFDIIYSRYKHVKNFYFIKDSIKNLELLKKLDKRKCVAISHHGTVVLELAYLGFKSITSKSNFFSDSFNVSNFWKNKEEYIYQLNKNHADLKNANLQDLYCLVFELFFDQKKFYGKYSFNKIVENSLIPKLRKKIMSGGRFHNEFAKKKINEIIPINLQNKIINKVSRVITAD